MADDNTYEKAVLALQEAVDRTLEEHGAIEMDSDHNYVGYIRLEPDGRYSEEVFSWGVNRGKVYGDSIEDVKRNTYEQFK